MKATKKLKKVLCTGLAGVLILGCLAGCGNETEPTAKVSGGATSASKGTKKPAAAKETEKPTKDKEEPNATEAPKETVIEPLPELVNSEWYDFKVQICDMVFNYGHTTEEDIRKIVEESAYDVALTEEYDGNGDVSYMRLMVDGKFSAKFSKTKPSRLLSLGKYGWFNDEFFFLGDYGWRTVDCIWYDKASVEFKDFKTRDDVLAYLTENNFVEVEKEQAPYIKTIEKGNNTIFPNQTPAEFADVPHYYFDKPQNCIGAPECEATQSITFCRIHKLDETDQVIENYSRQYSGAHLNLVNLVTFEFDTNGTITTCKPGAADIYTLSKYVQGYYRLRETTKIIMIAGEQIN